MRTPLEVVFLWHMHQPDYRLHGDPATVIFGGTAPESAGGCAAGEFVLPWVYLHALKDYADMAAHLERHPQIRCVVNFVPVLLDQLADYRQQFASGQFRDPLLRLLARPDLDHLDAAERRFLLATCFRSNHLTMLTPFAHYQRLHALYVLASRDGEAPSDYFSGRYFADLLTWYHLAWTGEAERRSNPLIAALISKGQGFDAHDRQQLLAAIGRLLSGLTGRYRALAERGQIELSTTPQTHPLAPLLIDFQCAREALPATALPAAGQYPGGHTRVCAQIAAALQAHRAHFGSAPLGMWPAEGAISSAFVRHLAQAGVRWIASGEGVLRNSLAAQPVAGAHGATTPWQLPEAPGLTLFFRNERLSDLIGFDYAKWHGRDAAQHLVNELEAIAAATPDGETAVVSIILDGENAWEHYPYNGYFFFDDLYTLLAAHPRIRTTTFADVLARQPASVSLPRLVAGSWVYGTLSTWIGDAHKNRAWDLLCAAKQSVDMVLASGRLDAAAATRVEAQLAVCESSDWFWWFGDINPVAAVASFDTLFRANLAQLYCCLGIAPPAVLEQTLCARSADPAAMSTPGAGSMRRASEPG